MADNNLDIRARLTGEDHLSPTVVKLLAKIKSLEEQMAKFGQKAKSAITDIPMENYVKQINATGKALNGLTQKHLTWAKANGATGEQAQFTWGKLTNEIQRAQKEHEKWSNSTTRGSKKRAREARDELNQLYKNAQAFKYVYNKSGDQRLDIQRRVQQELGNLTATHLRNEQMRERTHLSQISRMRRDAMRSMHYMANIGSRAGPYAAAAAAATGYAGVSAFRTRMKADTAETNLREFGGMNQDQVREWRKSYGNRAAIQFGMKPDEMINAYTEVLKAGIPKDKAQAVTDTILKSGAGLDLDLKETTRFATRLATLTQDMSNLDPEKLKKMLNSVAVAGIETAADPNEIIAANRRASGAFSSSKFDPNNMSAFTGAAISAGLPSMKSGSFIGFIVNELVGGKFAKGQRAQDLGKAANMLGFGNRQNMSNLMASNPEETLMRIFDKMGGMSEQNSSRVATLLGMREWRDELQVFVQVRDDVHRTFDAIHDPKNANKLDEVSAAKLKSLAGRWKSLVAAMTLVWEAAGAGLEKAFGQISEFFTDYLGKLDTSKISKVVESFTDGIVAGLGYESWTAMLQAAFGDPATVRDWSTQVFGFAKGFMTGMREIVDDVSFIFKGVMKAMGYASNDPEALGKFTAKLIEFAAALKGIGMLGEALASINTFLQGIVAIMGGPPAIATFLGYKAYQHSEDGVPEANIRKPGETANQWRERQRQHKNSLYHKSSYTSSDGFDPSAVHPAAYYGRSQVDDLASQLGKFGGKVERAAFISSGPGGGLQNAFASTGGGGGGGGLVSVSTGGGGSSIGGVPPIMKSVPGTALPDFGVGSSGAIIGRDKVPSIGGGSGAGDGVGAGRGGSSFLAARRARFSEEIQNDPTLRMHLAAMQLSEGASGGGTIEALMNRADMQGKSLRQMLGLSSDGVASKNSFYGPIRFNWRDHKFDRAMSDLRANPKLLAKMNGYTDAAIAGSHRIGGYTDQGLPTDPNGSLRGGRGREILKLGGNEFLDWNGPRSSWGAGHAGSENYRRFIQQHINDVPSASDTIKNVPVPAAGGGGGGVGGGDARVAPGSVAIHINGSSHDPEALATLVQRRIDESMNWRTHDTASEYT